MPPFLTEEGTLGPNSFEPWPTKSIDPRLIYNCGNFDVFVLLWSCFMLELWSTSPPHHHPPLFLLLLLFLPPPTPNMLWTVCFVHWCLFFDDAPSTTIACLRWGKTCPVVVEEEEELKFVNRGWIFLF